MHGKSHFPSEAQSWLQTPLGHALLQTESRLVEEAFDGIFGEQCLQLGAWGDAQTFLRHSRTQRKWLIDEGGGPAAIGQFHRLPVRDNSVDCVLLPHVLDYSDRPHAILREVDRVLTAHGHMVIFGFKTGGLWGVRRLVPGAPRGGSQPAAGRSRRAGGTHLQRGRHARRPPLPGPGSF